MELRCAETHNRVERETREKVVRSKIEDIGGWKFVNLSDVGDALMTKMGMIKINAECPAVRNTAYRSIGSSSIAANVF